MLKSPSHLMWSSICTIFFFESIIPMREWRLQLMLKSPSHPVCSSMCTVFFFFGFDAGIVDVVHAQDTLPSCVVFCFRVCNALFPFVPPFPVTAEVVTASLHCRMLEALSHLGFCSICLFLLCQAIVFGVVTAALRCRILESLSHLVRCSIISSAPFFPLVYSSGGFIGT